MKLLIAIIALVSATVASAQSRIVSIDAFDISYTGGLLIKNDRSKGSDREQTTFRLNLNYAQKWDQYVGMMWKVRAYINREEVEWGGDTLDSRWGAAGGVLYNFDAENIKNSIFAGAMAGIERQTVEVEPEDDQSGFNIFVDFEAGKRWDLGQYSVANISYAPSLALTLKRYGGDIRDDYFKSGNELRINFLKFDILF